MSGNRIHRQRTPVSGSRSAPGPSKPAAQAPAKRPAVASRASQHDASSFSTTLDHARLWASFNARTAAPVKPAQAQTSKVVGNARDRAEFRELRELLSRSPAGRAALRYIERKNLTIDFASGTGSYWTGKKIVLDRRQSTALTALTLVHEVEHARADLRGVSANDRIGSLSRSEYVRQAITEEVRGTVRSIQAKRELNARGVDTGRASFPLEREYNAAYDRAATEYRERHPSASDARVDAAGRRAGTARVKRGFLRGEVVTTNNGQTYPEYYAAAWNRYHGR